MTSFQHVLVSELGRDRRAGLVCFILAPAQLDAVRFEDLATDGRACERVLTRV